MVPSLQRLYIHFECVRNRKTTFSTLVFCVTGAKVITIIYIQKFNRGKTLIKELPPEAYHQDSRRHQPEVQAHTTDQSNR